jgi:hypothetical protein
MRLPVRGYVLKAERSRQTLRSATRRECAQSGSHTGGPAGALGACVSLWEALVMDLGLVVFFLVYTFVFNWAFDAVFGLPVSASVVVTPEAC